MLSRNKIKYLGSLKLKKFRTLHGQFIIEGDKIVKDTLRNGKVSVSQLIATGIWLNENRALLSAAVKEVFEANAVDLSRISALDTPPDVMAVLDIPRAAIDHVEISGSLSVALDNVQDPGNLGTIIRTANWFGIQNILCSHECADVFNPKVIQASMGALLNLKVHYLNLKDLLIQHTGSSEYVIYGTFMQGTPVFECIPAKRGVILFGNEARGISEELMPFIQSRITIPPATRRGAQVESLNVASAVAIVCAFLARN